MKNTTKSSTTWLSTEKLLLLFVMIIGFYGLRIALGPMNTQKEFTTSEVYQRVLVSAEEAIQIKGSLRSNDPIQFNIQLPAHPTQTYRIDFGNGIVKPLRNGTFTYAYKKAGKYRIEIKNKKELIYHTTIEIRDDMPNMGPLVMN